MNGALIVFEGLDGCGKTTQLENLKKWLKDKGYKVFSTEWHASVEVKKAMTKGGARRRMLSPITSNLVHAMDFADRYTWQILPRLDSGYIILCDRYVYTAFARGVVRGCKLDWLQNVYDFATKPNAVFYLSVSPDIAIERILRDRPIMKYFESGYDLGFSQNVRESFLNFQGKVKANYDLLSEEYGFITLDGSLPKETLMDQIKDEMENVLGENFPTPSKKKKKVKEKVH